MTFPVKEETAQPSLSRAIQQLEGGLRNSCTFQPHAKSSIPARRKGNNGFDAFPWPALRASARGVDFVSAGG